MRTWRNYNYGAILGLIILFLAEFVLHRKIAFMMDDLWYGTNLVTGEKISSVRDVIESQIWHYHHWGGRSITHGILQLTLWGGEVFADFLNVGMTLILAWILCRIAEARNLFSVYAVSVMLISCNANIKMSMFWQAGAANYVYSAVWIFLFAGLYLNCVRKEMDFRLPFIEIWILPLGIMAGWSNENMGPASFLLALSVILYLKIKKRKVNIWLWEGALVSLIGSIIMILAPGNYVRTEIVSGQTWTQEIYDRFISMFRAGADFLFPTVIFMILLILVYMFVLNEKIELWILFLLGYAAVTYGAMILSPHYPDRATFGTMSACIIVIIALTEKIVKKISFIRPYFMLLYTSMWVYAVYSLAKEISAFL